MIPTIRLYGGAIAVVSGLYSVFLSTGGPDMAASAWIMLVLGVIVLLHGIVLFTPAAIRIGVRSGPLMIGYAVVMLALQAWMAATAGPTMGGTGMQGGMMDGAEMGSGSMGGAMMGAVGWDPGMVAIAILMLASGVIMTTRPGGMAMR